MIQVEQGRLRLGKPYAHHMDLCLNCRACETACPSGVEYGRLVEAARSEIERAYRRPWAERWARKFFFDYLLPSRRRLEMAGNVLRMFQRSGLEKALLTSGVLKIMPGRMDAVARLAPRMEKPFFTDWLGRVIPASGGRRYRVAFFAGCIANLAFARLNEATVRLLARNGCEVVIPKAQGCCGALHVHAGLRDTARQLAVANITAFAREGVDAIITNTAGCGAVLKEYPILFERADREWHEPAKGFSARVKDVTEFLASIDFCQDFAPVKARATYQDPCHLLHAQRIRSAPRKLLAAIPGLDLVELKEAEICCGSAGIYNVVQNEMAERLLAAKMRRIDETGADMILTANPGCLLQLRAGVARSTQNQRRVLHVVELLDEAGRKQELT
jgi:glycolate oxidase iron-sulfur subunit